MLRAGASYFALVFGAGFVLGAIRVPFLVPRFGERIAELLEMPVMLAVMILAARFVVGRFSAGGPAWAAVGALALSLLLAAELFLVVALQERTPAEYIASRDPVSGAVYLAMLVLYAVMPWLIARRARSRSGSDKA